MTGASTGIGEAAVRALRASGWDVVGVARRAERLEALAAQTGATAFPADLTDADQIEALATHLAQTGPVHAVVHVAGGARGTERVEDGLADKWRWMFEANVLAVQQLTAALLPQLRAAAADGGHADLLFVTSVAARDPYPGGSGYNAAKAAEAMIPQVLRQELHGEPIRITEIAPGLVHTEEFALRRLGGDAAAAEAVYSGVGEPLVADDIADLITYALNAPGHVNLDLVVIRPVAQAAPHLLARGPLRPRGED